MASVPFPRRAPAPLEGVRRELPRYYHSGNLGDIIYGCYAIKLAGGGHLLLGPEERHTAPCGNPIILEQFRRLEPLLRQQMYLASVGFRGQYPSGTIDLNGFRDLWMNQTVRKRTGINNLAQMHAYLLGVARRFRADEPWLAVPFVKPSGRIAVARSFLYWAPAFPWKALVERYGHLMDFIGWEQEWAYFCQQFGKVEYRTVKDFLELAQVIRAARAFVGNQSFPCAVASGLGQRVYQETDPTTPDAMFGPATFRSKRFLNQFDKPEEFDRWLQ